MAKEKLLLKNELFNKKTVTVLATCIKNVYVPFNQVLFVSEALEQFVDLELKERMTALEQLIEKHIKKSYSETLEILLASFEYLPESYEGFVFGAYLDFIMIKGCTDEYLEQSLYYMGEFTKVFSAEFAIRDFINNYPEETFKSLEKWSKSSNVDQRRLASEGTRQKLPWAKKINVAYKDPIFLLDQLFCDRERYVTRSVANHLNDVSKLDPDFVVALLRRWKESEQQLPQEMTYIINHALRTSIKKGHSNTLEFLGYNQKPQIEVFEVNIENPQIIIGETLCFSFKIKAEAKEDLMIDYNINYPMANGKRSDKVFKIKKTTLSKGELLQVSKKHPFRVMTTKKLYSGLYRLSIQINGERFACKEFHIEV